MQDRYFGDVGDYGKYGLLRTLAGVYPTADALRLGIVWYLTDNETHNNDGKHVGYLSRPEFQACDPHLFESLRSVSSLDRMVAHIPRMGVFPEETVLFDSLLSFAGVAPAQRVAHRRQWMDSALEATQDCELIFCDPDNGLTDSDARLRSQTGPKFTGLEEAAEFSRRGQSLLVYHHADRSAPVAVQAARRMAQLRAATGNDDVMCLSFRRGTVRLFLLAPAPAHSALLRERAATLVASPWGAHFELTEAD